MSCRAAVAGMTTKNVGLPESRAPRGLHVPCVDQQDSRWADIDLLPCRGRMFDKQHWSSLQSTSHLQHFDSDSRTYEKSPKVRTARRLRSHQRNKPLSFTSSLSLRPQLHCRCRYHTLITGLCRVVSSGMIFRNITLATSTFWHCDLRRRRRRHRRHQMSSSSSSQDKSQ